MSVNSDIEVICTIWVYKNDSYDYQLFYSYFSWYGDIIAMYAGTSFLLIEFKYVDDMEDVLNYEKFYNVKKSNKNIYYNRGSNGEIIDINAFKQNDLIKIKKRRNREAISISYSEGYIQGYKDGICQGPGTQSPIQTDIQGLISPDYKSFESTKWYPPDNNYLFQPTIQVRSNQNLSYPQLSHYGAKRPR